MGILKWLKILSELNETDISNLELFCQEKFIQRGKVLFSEWENANAMYIIKSGSFNITKDINWKETSIWKVIAEEILWEMAIFSETTAKRMATSTALEDSTLIVLLNFSIKELTKKYPELLEKIRNIIEERNIKNKMI